MDKQNKEIKSNKIHCEKASLASPPQLLSASVATVRPFSPVPAFSVWARSKDREKRKRGEKIE